jgi:ATP-dependent helicase/nuclease subunit B
MQVQRIFLGVDRPAVDSALAWWFPTRETGNSLNVSAPNALFVLPTESVQQRFIAALQGKSVGKGDTELAPKVITIDQLPEYLFAPPGPYLDEFQVPWHWGLAIRELASEYRTGWLKPGSHDSAFDQLQDDMQTGRWVASLHQDLTAEGFLFRDIAKRIRDTDRIAHEQWMSLAAAEEQYGRALAELNLGDKQLSRITALRRQECQFAGHIILVAIAELPHLQRRMLEATEASVTALVYAPATWSDRFDSMGKLETAVWGGFDLQISNRQWSVADNPMQAIDSASNLVRDWLGAGQARAINVVSMDRASVPLLKFGFKRNAIAARCDVPCDLRKSTAAEFVRALAEFIRARSFRSFAEFIRHPYWCLWLEAAGFTESWLTDLDQYAAEHLPTHFGVPDIPPASANSSVPELNRKIILQMNDFSSTLATLPTWASRILKLIDHLIGSCSDINMSSSGQHNEHLDHVCTRLRSFEAYRSAFRESLDGSTACQLMLESLEDDLLEAYFVDSLAAEVSIVDWTDCLLNSSDGTILIGLNEGYVPARVALDVDLPAEYREFVRARDGNFQQARDRMILATLLASQPVSHYCVLRTDLDEAPLKPSRLLFSLQDEQDVVVKWRNFISDDGLRRERVGQATGRSSRTSGASLSVPRPPAGPIKFNEIRVTAFRSYLECPYRFWLQHVQKLEILEDSAEELDHFGFGNLAHGVLEHFGRGPFRDERDPDRIAEVLHQLLAQHMTAMFGPHPSIAVQIQAEQLESRLRAFAVVQAGFVNDGWRIRYIEQPTSDKAVYLPKIVPKVRLRGRIDRIDVHEPTGAWRVLDYKTSATAKTPRKAHMQNDAWADLQLPLYRHLAKALGRPKSVEFGYLNLPQNIGDTGLQLADWSAIELADADDQARKIIRKIRAGEFWPPNSLSFASSDPWEDICLVGVRHG